MRSAPTYVAAATLGAAALFGGLGCGEDEDAVTTTNNAGVGDTAADSSEPVELPDPCTLLTASEVSSILENEVDEGVLTERPELNGRECGWAPPAGNASGRGVSVLIRGTTEYYSASELFDNDRTGIAEDPSDVTDVPDVGEAAYGVVSNLNGGSEVKVLQGDYYLTVSIGKPDVMTEEDFAMAQELAAKATAGL